MEYADPEEESLTVRASVAQPPVGEVGSLHLLLSAIQ